MVDGSDSDARGTRLAHLDGLRGLSIAWVVAYHLAPEWARGGFVGVDVFFVLSGFLITGLIRRALLDDTWSVAAFYRRRVRRLFPALTVVLLATLAAGCAWLSPSELVELGWNGVAGAGFGANFLLWGQAGYFDTAMARKPLMHLWSLGVEEQFYLVWPWLLWGAWRLGQDRALRSVLPLVAIASYAVCLGLSWTDPTAAFYAPWSRVWELALGGVVAGIASTGPRVAAGEALGALGLVGIGAVAMGLGSDLPTAGAALLPVLGACLLLWAGPGVGVNRALSARPFVWLGELSYALYLWHWPVWVFAALLTPHPLTTANRFDVLWVSLLLAWVTTRVVERPIQARSASPGQAIVLSLALVVVAALGMGVIQSDGAPGRFPPEVQTLIRVRPVEDRGEKAHCFLEPDQGADRFGPTCVDRSAPRRVVVWGDSHAASLVPGVRVWAATQGLAVSQLTSSLCPPILGFQEPDHPNCAPVNQAVLDTVRTLQPELVLLGASWRYDLAGLADTVSALRAAGVPHVVVLGPAPWWDRPLPDAVMAYARTSLDHPLLPNRRLEELAQDGGDPPVIAALRGTDAVFVSAREVLCDAQGCLTRVGDGAGELTSLDGSHLSAAGATWLFGQVGPTLTGLLSSASTAPAAPAAPAASP